MFVFLHKILLLLSVMFLPVSKPSHPFYVSVFEITHNEQTQCFEIITKIFTDDFEHTLRMSNPGVKIDLLKPEMYEAMMPLVEKYIIAHFRLFADNKNVELSFIGFEEEEEGILSYFESKPVAKPAEIKVKSDLLYEYKKEQVNIYHVKVGGKRISYKLNNPNTDAGFDFRGR